MLRSCNGASARAYPLEYTFPSTSSRSKLGFCRAAASASQQHVQLRLDHFDTAENLSRSTLSQDISSKENTNGGFRNDKRADLSLAGDRPSDDLVVGELGNGGSSLLYEERGSSRRADQSSSWSKTKAELPADDDDDIDGPFEPITKINVPKQKYIPISKVSLVKALADAFNDDKKAADFLTICSLLDFILHAEHKTTLEQMRLDYKFIQSALKKESQNAKGKAGGRLKDRKKKGWLSKFWELWSLRRSESQLGKAVSISMKKQLKKLTLDEIDKLSSSNGSRSLAPNEGKFEQGDASLQIGGNGTLSSKPDTSTSSTTLASSDGTTRTSILAAARFQRSFLKLLKHARFQGLSTRDLQLTSALNTDYLLTLPIEVDWKHTSSEVAIIFRHTTL